MRQIISVLFLFVFPLFSFTQINVKDSSVFAPLLGFSYAFQIPDGNLVTHYGPNSNIGGNFIVKTKNNWLYGLDGSFLFGSNVKDTMVLNHLETDQGFIIDRDGRFAEVLFYERGFSLSARGGKVLALGKPNPNSGIILLAGIGFLQHKMRIEITGNTVPQLSSEYRKGYDRLSNGPAFTQFVGYQYLSSRRLINFFGGLEAVAAYTENRRGYNYDTMEYDTEKHLDLLFGIRFGWILPLYKKMPQAYYFN